MKNSVRTTRQHAGAVSHFLRRGTLRTWIQHVVDKRSTQLRTADIPIAVTMNIVGLLGGQETRSYWKRKGAGDETVVTKSSSTTVKRSNISAAHKMAQDKSEPALYQSIALFVERNSDETFIRIMQRNPAHLLAHVRLLVSGAQDLSDQDITEQFLAALPRPEEAPPRQEGAAPLLEEAAPRQEGAAPLQEGAAPRQEGPMKAPQLAA